METPAKYKSTPITAVYNRTIVLTNTTQKASVQTILAKFVQFLKAKHS
jgi:hypothetical protein